VSRAHRAPGPSRPRAGQAGTTGAHPRRRRRCRHVSRCRSRKRWARTSPAVTGPRNVDVTRSLGADDVIDYSKETHGVVPTGTTQFVDISATRSLADLRRVLSPTGMFVQVGAPKSGGWIGVFAGSST